MKKYVYTKWTAGFLGLAVLLGTIACNSGGGGSSAVVNPYGITGTVLSNPVVVYNSIPSYSSSGDFLMNMAMYSQGGYNSYGNGGAGYPVAFQGQLTISDTLYCAPPGTYTLTTTQAGTMSGTSIGPMTLMASGPATIQMIVSYGIVLNAGSSVSFNMNIYVNGQPCGQVITE